ncbi:1-Cys peroxiredoxin [Quillaja saponaria]|uniref:Peroxiredoxin n=1 Tax=Quillaja saponaria TaxID=32244 RepID=A0AAD7VM36_QUISA|nr:1-Cys peroxiredoxin [Quillaja saponaria]
MQATGHPPSHEARYTCHVLFMQRNLHHSLIRLHQYIGDGWVILFSHPGDFTPVCTTELGKMSAYANKFAQRRVKLLGLSCDDVQSHNDWIKDIEAYTTGCKVDYPIIADPNRQLIKQLNMVDPDEKDSEGNQIKLSFLYPASTGRNMDEVLRALDSLQKAQKFKVATPVNWKPGDPVVIPPNVTSEQAKDMFPDILKGTKLQT